MQYIANAIEIHTIVLTIVFVALSEFVGRAIKISARLLGVACILFLAAILFSHFRDFALCKNGDLLCPTPGIVHYILAQILSALVGFCIYRTILFVSGKHSQNNWRRKILSIATLFVPFVFLNNLFLLPLNITIGLFFLAIFVFPFLLTRAERSPGGRIIHSIYIAALAAAFPFIAMILFVSTPWRLGL